MINTLTAQILLNIFHKSPLILKVSALPLYFGFMYLPSQIIVARLLLSLKMLEMEANLNKTSIN